MRIVVNPGHSDYEPGALGPNGLTEASVNQQVAIRLRDMGYECKRQGRFLSALTVGLRANKPDVLVSLHCNAGTTNRHECLVFYWLDDPDGRKRDLSHRLAAVIADHARGRFAEMAQPAVFPVWRDDKWFTPGIVKGTFKRAGVVVEMGFISDPHVETAMRQSSWADRAAQAIDAGIRAFVMQVEGGGGG